MNPDWERLWRSAGLQFVLFLVVAYVIYGSQPKVGASADQLVAFYDGNRTRILIATVVFAYAALNLLWFGAAVASALRDAGQGGWGAAATASSTALGTVYWLVVAVSAALAYSIAGSGNSMFTSGVNDVVWVVGGLASFPAAMLIMAGSFGLWRAGIFSNAAFGAGVAAVVLVLLRGTTWATDGFWAPDGVYSRFVAPVIALVWIAAVSGFLYARRPATARVPGGAAIATP
jgi:hypothetical protein